jgi:uncharacterized protein (DUF58 family)
MKATREGKRFLFASALIAAAAVNTGNNLIYLILALMLSLVVLSLVILKLNISKLSLSAESVSPVFAGKKASFSVTVKNRRRHISAYSVNILSEGMTSRAYFPVIPPGGEALQDVQILFPRRGLYGRRNFTAWSGFPFILFTGRKEMEVEGEVLVYPALRDIEGVVPDDWGSEEGEALRTAGSAEEVYSIREFRHSDDLRRVHWKASAKVSDLMVKEYGEYDLRRTTIILDNLIPHTQGESGKGGEAFEKAVSIAASLARFLIGKGNLVRIVSARKVVPFGSGDEQLFKVLDILALIAPEDSWESPLPVGTEGFTVAVLPTSRPSSADLTAVSDVVVHAETL